MARESSALPATELWVASWLDCGRSSRCSPWHHLQTAQPPSKPFPGPPVPQAQAQARLPNPIDTGPVAIAKPHTLPLAVSWSPLHMPFASQVGRV